MTSNVLDTNRASLLAAIDAAERAIARSVSHTEIVTIDWTAELEAALQSLCDDSGGGGYSGAPLEFWGTDDEGEEWRVHLAREIESAEDE